MIKEFSNQQVFYPWCRYEFTILLSEHLSLSAEHIPTAVGFKKTLTFRRLSKNVEVNVVVTPIPSVALYSIYFDSSDDFSFVRLLRKNPGDWEEKNCAKSRKTNS